MWAVPNLAEAGWGINFTRQGNTVFASWFTYDAGGKPWWLTMTAAQQADGSFAYTVNGFAQTKALTRFVFFPPATVCQ